MKTLTKRKKGTFKKIKIKEGSRIFRLQQSDQSLGAVDLRDRVKVPSGEDRNEWFAYQCTEFFNAVRIIFTSIQDSICTESSCPKMNAGPEYQYLWVDKKGGSKSKPMECSAPAYIDYLLQWIQELITDENIFPTMQGTPFPTKFNSIVKDIVRRLFRVYAHIYYTHINDITEVAHINTSFKHLFYFGLEFNLIPEKELEPLKLVIEDMKTQDEEELNRLDNNN